MSGLDSTVQLRRSRHTAVQAVTTVSTHGRDRACHAPGCETRLSRYNPSETCSRHAGWQDPRQRSRV
jgi:hypothetical protein